MNSRASFEMLLQRDTGGVGERLVEIPNQVGNEGLELARSQPLLVVVAPKRSGREAGVFEFVRLLVIPCARPYPTLKVFTQPSPASRLMVARMALESRTAAQKHTQRDFRDQP
jgi:hypothetical protein